MTSYKLIIFDFDGTLADSAKWMVVALRSLADRHKFKSPDDEVVEQLRNLSSREVLKSLGIASWRLPLIARDIRKLASGADIGLFPGVPDVLDALVAQGKKLAIASSNSHANITRILGPAVQRFEWMECGSSIFGKQLRIKRILTLSNLEPHEVLMVGDETRDVEAAAKAGLRCAAVSYGYASREALVAAKPTYVVESIRSLFDLLVEQEDRR